jgi:putative aminopeptidase FrvX
MKTSQYISTPQLQLIKNLSNALGVSGDEGEVRSIVIRELKEFSDQIKIDPLGNVLVTRHSKIPNALKVMLAAHMDEVGFMIVEIDEEGYCRFDIVGGMDVRYLPAKTVIIGKDHVPGVIGVKAIHLTQESERKSKMQLENLRIDLGPDRGKKIRLGDRGSFGTRFHQEGSSLFGKALDDRLGVAVLIELVKNAPKNIELQAAFTVQEEVGARGARVAAYRFNPELAFVLDCTPAMDFPVWDEEENTLYNTKLGHGPALYVADAGTLSDPRLIHFVQAMAEKTGIPYQIRQPGAGGTDASTIHKQRTGIPSISISIPHRYTHSPILIARLEDLENTLKLMVTVLSNIDRTVFHEER